MEKPLESKELRERTVRKAQQGEEKNPRNQMLKKFHLLLKDGWTPKAVTPFQRMLGKDGCMQVAKVVVIGIHRLKGGRYVELLYEKMQILKDPNSFR